VPLTLRDLPVTNYFAGSSAAFGASALRAALRAVLARSPSGHKKGVRGRWGHGCQQVAPTRHGDSAPLTTEPPTRSLRICAPATGVKGAARRYAMAYATLDTGHRRATGLAIGSVALTWPTSDRAPRAHSRPFGSVIRCNGLTRAGPWQTTGVAFALRKNGVRIPHSSRLGGVAETVIRSRRCRRCVGRLRGCVGRRRGGGAGISGWSG
jgi:hypothetical protein